MSQISGPLKTYLDVNLGSREISRDTRNLTRTPTVIKKSKSRKIKFLLIGIYIKINFW
jgi:hypothetical protein